MCVDWRNSCAKHIVLSDLNNGALPLEESEMTAEKAWNVHYSKLEEFKGVIFKQFKERLADHGVQMTRNMTRSLEEESFLLRDCDLCRTRTTNRKGEPVFDKSAAKLLLREDISNGLHKQMSRLQLQGSRNECEHFEAKIFEERIHQEVKRAKCINYLEWKHQQDRERTSMVQGTKKRKDTATARQRNEKKK